MTLAPEKFMRAILLHVLPYGFHHIRHYGLLANGSRKDNLALARELLAVASAQAAPSSSNERANGLHNAAPPTFVCSHCGHATVILQSLVRGL